MQLKFIFLINFYLIILTSSAGLPFNPYERRSSTTESNPGLYDENDKVIPLNGNNLKIRVFGKKHATLVEFYNSYCGACRRFASVWKEFANDIIAWRDIVLVTAIDCSNDENNGICREFEIMAYPTIRYFSPNYQDGTNQIGVDISGGKDVSSLRDNLITKLLEEADILQTLPHLQPSTNFNSEQIFDNLIDSIKFVILMNEPENSLVGANVILDLHSIPEISVLRKISSTVSVVAYNRNGAFTNLSTNGSRESIITVIKEFLHNHHINMITYGDKITPNDNIEENPNSSSNDSSFEAKLKLYKDKVFYADMEQALKYSIFHEISGVSIISGEKLLALQSYLTVLTKYFPFGPNGLKFLEELRNGILNTTTEISGLEFSNKANELQLKWVPVFTSNRWIRCHSNLSGLRGFPCGLWIMFHYLTVRASESNQSVDSLEVLQAMHRYVKHYFGCNDCSGHFQIMASRRKLWNVTSKDEAILWLWESHNEVNNRLAGDITEDPVYPKIQFPANEFCSECRRRNSNGNNSNSIEWNKTEVLIYLKRIYAFENLLMYDLDNEQQIPQSQHFLGNVFSDLDMRMGMLLYIFCVCMMIVAVKLFRRRGYKKKMYVHDLLGKV